MNELEKRILQNSTLYDNIDFNIELTKYPMTTGLTVFRGDDRNADEILSKGFSPWYLMDIQNLRSLVVDLVHDGEFQKSLWTWWKYPGQRTINMKNNPFVATGTKDAHLGKYKYKIQLEQFKMYQIPTGGSLFFQKIGFNGDSLDNSSIIALQIDKDEVVFGTTVPPRYIEFLL